MDQHGHPHELGTDRRRPIFRPALGLTVVGAGIIGLALLFFVPIPQPNENALLLALGIVLGWGGAVVASEYGASSTGRALSDATIDALRQSTNASEDAIKAPPDDFSR